VVRETATRPVFPETSGDRGDIGSGSVPRETRASTATVKRRPTRATDFAVFYFAAVAIDSMRRFISSGETSSTWVATCHTWPNGSSTVPMRSP